ADADATATGGDFVPVAYARLFDTTVGSTPFAAGETRSYQILGVDGIPATGVGAVVIDVAGWTTTATASSPSSISVGRPGQRGRTQRICWSTLTTCPGLTLWSSLRGPMGRSRSTTVLAPQT